MGVDLNSIAMLAGIGEWFALENILAVLGVVLGLSAVIFVHELGHFAVAKWCGVRCDKFYVGFDVPIKIGWGKYGFRLPASIWKRQWGETEYGVGILPLGGYVKMFGQDDNPAKAVEEMERAKVQNEGSEGEPYTLDPRSYMAKSVPQRMAIISAGVVMNVIFAVIFATIAYSMGVLYLPPTVGMVAAGDAAWTADIRPGDKIVEIGGRKIERFQDLQESILLGDVDDGVDVSIEREGKLLHVTLYPDSNRTFTKIGVAPARAVELVEKNPVQKGSPADAAGKFQGEDVVVKVGGVAVDDAVGIDLQEYANRDKPLVYAVRRAKEGDASSKPSEKETELVDIEVAPRPLRRFGVRIKFSAISAVQANSPAAAAGLKKGDELVELDGRKLEELDLLSLASEMDRRARANPEAKIPVVVMRDEKRLEFSLSPRPQTTDEIWERHVSIPALGLAFRPANVVASLDSTLYKGEGDKSLRPGDEFVALELIPKEERIEVETEKFGTLKFDFDDGDGRFPWAIRLMQHTFSDTKFRFTVKRDGKTQEIDARLVDTDQFNSDRGLAFQTLFETRTAESFGEAVRLGGKETLGAMTVVYRFLHKLRSKPSTAKGMSGPFGIAGVAFHFSKQGVGMLLVFLTMISANLAVINFLPIPVLDGGHMVFLAYEGIRGKPADERVVGLMQYLGLFLILGLMIWVFGLDLGLISRK